MYGKLSKKRLAKIEYLWFTIILFTLANTVYAYCRCNCLQQRKAIWRGLLRNLKSSKKERIDNVHLGS